MDSRDDWADEVLEGDLEAIAGEESEERRSAEQIARDVRNMNAVLSAMGERLGEGLPAVADGQVVPLRRRPAWRRRAMVALATAAAIAALILVRGDEVEEGGGRFAAAAPSMVREMDVEADGPFVVFPTSDPNIAVVWPLNLEESE